MPADPASSDSLPTRTSAVVEGAADGLADGLEREAIGDDVHAAMQRSSQAVRSHGSPRSERLRARLEQVDSKVDDVIDKTRLRARAVAESARRARDAPPAIANDLKAAGRSWLGGLAASVGFSAAAGVVGAIALGVLTVGLVQGLNALVGAPLGTFIVAVAYGLVALALFSAGKARAKRGREEARGQLAAARHEIRRVAKPVRRAFTGEPEPEAPSSPPLETTRLKL
jgi:hypothetical protein